MPLNIQPSFTVVNVVIRALLYTPLTQQNTGLSAESISTASFNSVHRKHIHTHTHTHTHTCIHTYIRTHTRHLLRTFSFPLQTN
ncbi:hypothetical protein LOAG_03338 [Loa loa]|uniref:Uncharacterized protein n=1 Tax=Loa loa TaxID=7209 RepID=A0A1S0U5E7_LOALO|nr:hypothetical protein LOAG_03338 [Loa loa]EFO25143.1 hypothetical protein LOAG_03338 [Loa loa]